jgi:hypothetical protein
MGSSDDFFMWSGLMLKLNATAYLCVPNPDNERVLIEAQVTGMEMPQAVFSFVEVPVLEAGAEVVLFAEVRGKFFQQGGQVVSSEIIEGKTLVRVQTMGEPVSAEQRGTYRVSAVTLNLGVKIGTLAGCVLADVSPEGVGVIVPKPLTVGSTVDVDIQVDAFRIAARFRVQGVKILPSGKLRFGLFLPDPRCDARRTLEKLAGHLQRTQLKRLSGAA